MVFGATGHRLQKLPCGFDEDHPWAKKVILNLTKFLLKGKPELIITGMAIGWDMWVARVCLKLDIPYKCYCPFPGQEQKWSFKLKEEYWDLLQ
jgi:uncharacterized phage-like protein YoqJ